MFVDKNIFISRKTDRIIMKNWGLTPPPAHSACNGLIQLAGGEPHVAEEPKWRKSGGGNNNEMGGGRDTMLEKELNRSFLGATCTVSCMSGPRNHL